MDILHINKQNNKWHFKQSYYKSNETMAAIAMNKVASDGNEQSSEQWQWGEVVSDGSGQSNKWWQWGELAMK